MDSKKSQEGRRVFAFLVIKNNVRKGVIASHSYERSWTKANEIFEYVCRYSNPQLDVVQLHRFSGDGTKTSVVRHWGGRPSWFEGIKIED